MSTTLTRSRFETACKAYIAKANVENPNSSSSWSWECHPTTKLGYLTRSVLFPLRHMDPVVDTDLEDSSYELEDPSDDGTTSNAASHIGICTSRQYVAFHPTFRVPAFYFTIHHSNGMPLSLDEIVRSSLLRQHTLEGTERTPYSVGDPGSPFPMLSQGDHPVFGTPFWYLHPCHTSEVVAEIMAEVQQENWVEEEVLVRWMEAWFMVLGQVVALDRGVSKFV
ncbi:hypothetical protein WOLCODRAFT_137241, partial [Wolfiporia cocos MD-104 SS10]